MAFSPNVGSALNSAVIGIVGSILGGALGMMIIALISALAMGFDYEQHSVTMVGYSSAAPGPSRCAEMPLHKLVKSVICLRHE